MSTDSEIATTFYGATTPAAKSAAPAASAEQSTADILFGATTKSKVEQGATSRNTNKVDVHNDRDMAELVYKDSPIYESPKLAIKNAAEREYLVNAEDAAKVAQSWEPTLRAFDLNATEAETLTHLGIAMSVNAPDPETTEAWVGDAKGALRQEYGVKAGEALQAAQRMIARDPSTARWLERTGLGNHPKFVRIAAAKAMALKARGKL